MPHNDSEKKTKETNGCKISQINQVKHTQKENN